MSRQQGNDLTRLEEWVSPLLAKLDSGERTQLARDLAFKLRSSQRQRIANQQNPDGSAFAPRKQQTVKNLRGKTGHIKRAAMFHKLRQAKYLKARISSGGKPNSISVGFFGQVATLARVHHYGLRDRVRPGGPEVQYEARQLLGFSKEDVEMIEEGLLGWLAG